MMTKMTIKDLKNGYFVMLRNGEMGMVQGEVIVMKKGFFYLDFEYEKYGDEEEDLTSIEDEDYDIMRVFRPESEGTRLEFGDFPEGYYGGEWIYNRDENWTPPTQKEREQKAAEEAAKRAAGQAEQDVAEEAAKRAAQQAEQDVAEEAAKRAAGQAEQDVAQEAAKRAAQQAEQDAQRKENEKNIIGIVAQAFYGNRTATEINRKDVDRFILGHLSDLCRFDDEKIDRTIIHIPNTDNLVMVYNKYQEERRRREAAEYLKRRICRQASCRDPGAEPRTLQQMHRLQNGCGRRTPEPGKR